MGGFHEYEHFPRSLLITDEDIVVAFWTIKAITELAHFSRMTSQPES